MQNTPQPPIDRPVLDAEIKILLPSELKKSLRIKTILEGTDMSDVVRRLIEQYVQDQQ